MYSALYYVIDGLDLRAEKASDDRKYKGDKLNQCESCLMR